MGFGAFWTFSSAMTGYWIDLTSLRLLLLIQACRMVVVMVVVVVVVVYGSIMLK